MNGFDLLAGFTLGGLFLAWIARLQWQIDNDHAQRAHNNTEGGDQ